MRAPALELKEEGAERFVNTSPIAEMFDRLNIAMFKTTSGSQYIVQYSKYEMTEREKSWNTKKTLLKVRRYDPSFTSPTHDSSSNQSE